MSEHIQVTLSDSEISFKKPVETPFGLMRFLTYDEYLDLDSQLGWVGQNVLHIFYLIRKTIPKENKQELKKLNQIKELSLRELVLEHTEILSAYQIILSYMLDINDYSKDSETFIPVLADIFSNDDSFLLMREYIMKMNLIKEEKVSPNPKLQEIFDRDKEVNKAKNKDTPTNSDIVFSVASLTPNSLDDVRKMSPIQVHNIYARISADKDYERNVLFATVSNEVEIESWAKKIDLFEIKDTSISKSAFERNSAGMFKQ
jgi:hypothetical protein